MLINCNYLRNLRLKDCGLADDILQSFAELLNENETIKFVSLQSNIITDAGIEILSQELSGNTSILSLDLAYIKQLTDFSTSHLIELAKTTNLEHLEVLHTNISILYKHQISNWLEIPIDQREIPIKFKAKSAAKSNQN